MKQTVVHRPLEAYERLSGGPQTNRDELKMMLLDLTVTDT